MTRTQFNAIIKDIEKHLEGDGYEITAHTVDGATFHGSWQWCPGAYAGREKEGDEVIILSMDDRPPRYVSVPHIITVHLKDR